MDNHFYIPQTQPLQNIVHSFWQTNRPAQNHAETIIPKGVIEIIFDFSQQPITATINNVQHTLARSFINGFNTQPINMRFKGLQQFFGVRLHPMAVKNILKILPGEFANITVDLTLIDDSFNHLWHQLAGQHKFEQRVEIVSNWLTQKWAAIDNRDALLNSFLNSNSANAIPTVPQLAKQLCYSPRQLARKMHTITGMNTEEVLLYKKYLLSTELMHANNMSLTQVAYYCQFADQSHFIKTFKQFAVITPGEYSAAKGHLPGHIYHNVR